MLVLLLILALVVIGVFWRRRTQQKQRRLVLRQLRNWLGAQETLEPALHRWVNGLSASEAEVLLDLLTGYCTSLNWELTWLFTPQLQKVPLLKQALEEAVIVYARALLASLQLVEEVRAYNAYVALLRKPNSQKQFALIQKLYQALNAQGVIPPVANQRSWFRRQPTRKQKIAAVITAFDHEPTRAMTALKTLLAAEAVTDVQQLTGVIAPLGGAMLAAA